MEKRWKVFIGEGIGICPGILNTQDRILVIQIQKQIKAPEVFYKLSELFLAQGLPDHIRSNNGSEFSAKSVRS